MGALESGVSFKKRSACLTAKLADKTRPAFAPVDQVFPSTKAIPVCYFLF